MNLQTLVLCSLLAFQGSPTPQDDGAERLLRGVPEDALVVLSTDDFDSIRAQLEGNAWWKLSQTESMQGWMDGLWDSLDDENAFVTNVDAGEEESAPAEDAPSEDAAQARKVMEQMSAFMQTVHGPSVVFLTLTDLSDEPTGFVGVLVDPGADRAAFEGWVDRFLEEGLGSGASETNTYNGTDLRLYERQDGQGARIDHFSYFEHAGVAALLAADSREQLLTGAHGVVDRLKTKDGSNGVLGNPRFQAARGAGPAKGRIDFYCDLGRFIELGLRDEPADEEGLQMMQIFGIQNLTWMRARCEIGQDEQFDFELAMELPKEGAIARLLSHVRPCSDAFVRSIPRDAVGVSLFGLDVAGLWKEGWAIAAEVDAEAAEEARKQLDGAGQMLGGADVEADFIEQLSGEVATFNVAVPDDEWRAALGASLEAMPEEMRTMLERMPKVGSAFVIGLKDGKVVEGFVEKLLETSGVAANIEIEEFQGDEISVLELPGTGMSFSWAFQDQRLVVSQFPTALRALLTHKPDAEAGGIDKNPRWGPHLAANKGAAMLALASTPDSLKAMSTTFETLGAMLPNNPATSLFTSGWPPPETIEKLFSGAMIMSLTRTPNLLSMRIATR